MTLARGGSSVRGQARNARAVTGETTMLRSRTPRWAWPHCLAVLALAALSLPAQAAQECVDARINLQNTTLQDFTFTNGSWVPTVISINGNPSKPEPQHGGVYQWSFVGPAAGTLSGANTPQPSFTAPDVTASTQVTLRLTVSAAGCGSDTADVVLTITNAHDVVQNRAPHAVAAASPSSAAEGVLVTLDGSGSSDPNGDPLTYEWTQLEGPAVLLQPGSTPAIRSFVAPNLAADATLRFRLRVTDPGTLSNTADAYVNVVWQNDGPIAALACPPSGGFEVDEGQSVTLDGSGSTDSDDGIASYAWQQLEGLPEVPDVATWTAPSVTFAAPPLGFQESGLIPFQLTVTDHQGAKSTATCSVFVHDVTRPQIAVPADIVAEASSAAGAYVGAADDYVVSAADAVDGPLPPVNTSEYFVCEPPPGALFALDRVTPVLCSATDSAGNEATASFTVSVLDRIGPVVAVPESFAVEATGPQGATASFEATATDAVDGVTPASCVPASGDVFPIASPGPSTVVTCSARDAHDNDGANRSFTVTVHDTTPPVFDAATVSADLVAEATSASGAAATYVSPAASDLVDLADVSVACAPPSGSVFPLGDTTVECDATDRRGNTTQGHAPTAEKPGATARFQVRVQDTTPPVFGGVPGDVVLEAASAAGTAYDHALPVATDAVDGVRPVTCGYSPALATAGVFPLGTTTVTCDASDTRGNGTAAAGTSAVFSVTVLDRTPPTLTVPAAITAEATGPAGANVAFAVTAIDTVDADVAPVCSAQPGDLFPIATTAVACTATDDAGNTATAGFTVTVEDTTGPAIAWHADVHATATGDSSAVADYVPPTASDLVDGAVEVTCTPATGSVFNVGSTTVTCRASDSRGNASDSSFAVVVSYAWTGFFQPIDNAPVLNTVKAGSAVPVKFSLGGNQGLSIFASGPASGVIACGATEGDVIEETYTAGGSGLQYDAAANQYIYVWKTEKSWAGQCRVLQLRFRDGSTKSALFKFK